MERGLPGRRPTAQVGPDGLTVDQRRYKKHRERRKAQARQYWRQKMKDPAKRAAHNAYQRADYRRRIIEDPGYRAMRRDENKQWYADHRAYFALKNARSAQTMEQKARVRLYFAVQRGDVAKPLQCQGCGKPGSLHGHHHRGYSKQHELDVLWLCPPCHGLVHRRYKD